MKGLLIKDFKLLKVQKRFIAIIVVVIGGMALYGSQNTSFLVLYATLIGCVLPMSSVTYDEMDDGNVFLFSLPVSRKGYVIEKYIYCIICGGVAWLTGAAAAAVSGIVKDAGTAGDAFMAALPYLPVMLVILAVMLPFQLFFGSEKGRLVYLIMAGGGVVAGVLVSEISETLHIDLEKWMEAVTSLNLEMLAAGAVVLAAALVLLSCSISVGIMKKKEF